MDVRHTSGVGDASSSWVRWHADYDDPGSDLAQRLSVVRVRLALDSAGPGPVRLISACAGQGLDVIGSLTGHARADDVSALLVEWEDRNVDVVRAPPPPPGSQVSRSCTGTHR